MPPNQAGTPLRMSYIELLHTAEKITKGLIIAVKFYGKLLAVFCKKVDYVLP